MTGVVLRLIGDALDRATTLPAPAGSPNRDLAVFVACLAITALSGGALLLLRNPRSFLSRLVDGTSAADTDRKALR